MKKVTIYINDKNLKNIEKYQSLNILKTRTEALNNILENYFESDFSINDVEAINNKIDRLLKLTNLLKSLTEQFFANNGFRLNKNIKDDKMLNEFYRDIQKSKYNFLD
jgi:hypothetical protein